MKKILTVMAICQVLSFSLGVLANPAVTRKPSASVESTLDNCNLTYNHLLIIYLNTDANYVKDGVSQRYTGGMSNSHKTTIENAFKNLPNLTFDGSAGVTSTAYQIIEVSTPVTQITPLGGNRYWLSDIDARSDTDRYVLNGTYDSVSVVWNNGPIDAYFGLGGTFINNGRTTFSSLIAGQEFFWTGARIGEPFLHEWLHGVCRFYAGLGYVMPDQDADGGGSHGYVHSDTDGWMGYYRDLMQGKVWEPRLARFTGITAAAWHRGTANRPCQTPDTDSDGIPDVVEVEEGTNPNVKDNDVFVNTRLFVMQQYRDFLGREGDPGGISFWTNLINSGSLTRAQVIDSFFNSPEFQGTVSPVTRLYFAYFLRIPDYEGLNFWVNQYRQGATLDSISQAFSESPEFQATYGSLDNTQFVTLLYLNVLGRAPDPGGLAFWVGQLNSGAMTRGQVMLGFSESPEYKQTSFNKVYVTMIYVGMLRRAPEQGGFDFWVNQLNGGASGLNLIQGFLNAPEYHNRFLP
jgi:Domain of unknown function (DUF4214)